MHVRPGNFDELFEFLRYCKVKNVLTEREMASAKARAEDG
jgi:hypothetical protein